MKCEWSEVHFPSYWYEGTFPQCKVSSLSKDKSYASIITWPSLVPCHSTRMTWHRNLYYLGTESQVVNFRQMFLIHKLCVCIEVLLSGCTEVCTIKYTKTWNLVIVSFYCSKSLKHVFLSKMLCSFFSSFSSWMRTILNNFQVILIWKSNLFSQGNKMF